METEETALWDRYALATNTGLSLRMAERIIAERRIPVVRIGRRVMVRPADVNAYIEANTIPAVKQ